MSIPESALMEISIPKPAPVGICIPETEEWEDLIRIFVKKYNRNADDPCTPVK